MSFILSEPSGPEELSQQELDDLWDEVSSELSAIFQGRAEIPDDVTPFDAASEIDVDQQRYINVDIQLVFKYHQLRITNKIP